MLFLVVKKQRGEGCDYTIGCGMRYDWVEATSMEEVEDKTIWPDGPFESSLEGEMGLCEILIIPRDCVHVMDVNGISDLIAIHRKSENEAKNREKELAELKRLREKYGQ